ncbi:DUF3995 domain-containing protein [Natronoglycomyces albus]|uniref:DUF3995 domain-containing protein n=1 Tax=Natronoglycomyces albus TaxID=2811108 RepID=A0A895XLV1_9ACTN|nr:DUF3995 domain-containing protein [Natronoglycomyces albus]QSB06324.1 DUF3995 domain-containing protein [Natronoglycomyces albus]
MKTPSTSSPTTVPTPLSANWAAWALIVWSVPFAALSFYWAAGGTWAAEQVSPDARDMVSERIWWFMLLLWMVAIVKLGYAAYALALMQDWGRIFPRWLLLLGGWGVGTVTALYGAGPLAMSLPVYLGINNHPNAPSPEILRWHVWLWQPYWILGGLLVLCAVFIYQRRSLHLRRWEAAQVASPTHEEAAASGGDDPR